MGASKTTTKWCRKVAHGKHAFKITYRTNVDAFRRIGAEGFQLAADFADEPGNLDWRRRPSPRGGGNWYLNHLHRVKTGAVAFWYVV